MASMCAVEWQCVCAVDAFQIHCECFRVHVRLGTEKERTNKVIFLKFKKSGKCK